MELKLGMRFGRYVVAGREMEEKIETSVRMARCDATYTSLISSG